MKRSDLIEELAAAIAAVRLPHPTRVGIDGVDAVGKTSLANELVEPLEKRGRHVVRASVDGFHHPKDIRYRRGSDSAEGYFFDSFNYPAVRSELSIRSGRRARGCFEGPRSTTASIDRSRCRKKPRMPTRFSCSMACSCPAS